MITECEWRKQWRGNKRNHSTLWGAQCWLINSNELTHFKKKTCSILCLLGSIIISLLMPLFSPITGHETFSDIVWPSDSSEACTREIEAISYVYPTGMERITTVYTHEQLLRGKMLLLDQEHPLPANAPAPNTVSIAQFGKGRVPVQNLQIKCGRGTIEAAAALFADLQERGIHGLIVTEGTISYAQQLEQLETQARTLMRQTGIRSAVEQALVQHDKPGYGEMLQEHTIAISEQNTQKASRWEQLVRIAWKHGFVRTNPQESIRSEKRFRWVGRAHATAMTYLDLTLKDYLLWMHEKGVLTIEEEGVVRYMILCKPITGTHVAFDLPVGAECEASLDNLGYAIVACSFEKENGSLKQ